MSPEGPNPFEKRMKQEVYSSYLDRSMSPASETPGVG